MIIEVKTNEDSAIVRIACLSLPHASLLLTIFTPSRPPPWDGRWRANLDYSSGSPDDLCASVEFTVSKSSDNKPLDPQLVKGYFKGLERYLESLDRKSAVLEFAKNLKISVG